MKLAEYARKAAQKTKLGARLTNDRRYRVIAKAVAVLIYNLVYALYNGILGALSSSLIFAASSVYYFLLSAMRFSAVLYGKSREKEKDRRSASLIGVMLIALSIIFHVMLVLSFRDASAAVYGEITMITIATFTFTKITAAAVTAVKHRKDNNLLFKAVNAIRYSEIAVSVLTMQQSMLVSFGEGESGATALNACTGAGVCLFICALGVGTFKNARSCSGE